LAEEVCNEVQQLREENDELRAAVSLLAAQVFQGDTDEFYARVREYVNGTALDRASGKTGAAESPTAPRPRTGPRCTPARDRSRRKSRGPVRNQFRDAEIPSRAFPEVGGADYEAATTQRRQGFLLLWPLDPGRRLPLASSRLPAGARNSPDLVPAPNSGTK